MVTSFKTLQELISSMNVTVLRQTPYGLGIEHTNSGSVHRISRKYRSFKNKSKEGQVFEGNARECNAYLHGLKDALTEWVPMLEVK